LKVEGSAVLDAYLNDPDVVGEMAKTYNPVGRGSRKPSLFGWTAELSALKDIQDQMIASRGGQKFVPRPEIPGHKHYWDKADDKLSNTIERLTGQK
jgi:hypothetical protein